MMANTPSLQELRCRVFKDLWTKGYYLTAGLKYGGDYLVYPGNSAGHAHSVLNTPERDKNCYLQAIV